MSADTQLPSTSQPTGDGTRMAVRGPIVSANGTAGQALAMRDLGRIAIWQLSGAFQRQVNDGVRDDVPSAAAEPVWFFATDGSSPDSSYRNAGAASRSLRVYHVGAFPGDRRSQLEAVATEQAGEMGIPKYAAGDRAFARFNNQSGRWEILGPAEDLWRFELKTALAPGADRNVPGTADAYLVVYDSTGASYVRTDVEFQVADFLGVLAGQPRLPGLRQTDGRFVFQRRLGSRSNGNRVRSLNGSVLHFRMATSNELTRS